ncbi:SDR family NAD(P)-dependent oxidoreductase [Neisseria perflava]|uniref:SDR family NAD(P)-dependent oxidoreductase n=1 Tax=Neisseria perflava TaxID=33053 RepID=UPI00209E144F|nr:SDR family oxidoreductase [Neisseria perflava]MCP1661047.1 NAD(P)-dependent dehydrogenase (short-subunit alcohol dehydrogenase family) [Neisseria perflava]MCP1772328.1 NAD(P)-dependent dehydrogenase (short-subunit alcohol dehydrogenase family) [Neisseria perflava]
MKRNTDLLQAGRVAVITGAAKGIGAALAEHFARLGLRLCLLDNDGAALAQLAERLDTEVCCITGDVCDTAALTRLRDTAFDRFGETAILVNNAGISAGADPWHDMVAWRRQMEVNFFSIVQTQILFVEPMLAQAGRSAIINLGSKEGITTPPGNAAYSVAKAGVKVLTEQLAHELLMAAGDKITAHLFVPGYTWTPMNFPHQDLSNLADKPDEPWTAAQLIDYFIPRFEQGDFYILCPDNAVNAELDALRLQWAADDLILNRPALSRWHPDYREAFAAYVSDGLAKNNHVTGAAK